MVRKVFGQHRRDGVNASGDVGDQTLENAMMGERFAQDVQELPDELLDYLMEILGERRDKHAKELRIEIQKRGKCGFLPCFDRDVQPGIM